MTNEEIAVILSEVKNAKEVLGNVDLYTTNMQQKRISQRDCQKVYNILFKLQKYIERRIDNE